MGASPKARKLVIAAAVTLVALFAALVTVFAFVDPQWSVWSVALVALGSCIAGFGGAILAAHVRRRDLVVRSLAVMDGLFDGVAIYRRGGEPLLTPKGVLNRHPDAAGRDRLVEGLLADAVECRDVIADDDSPTVQRALLDGKHAMVEIRLRDGAVVQVGQLPTGFGPVLIVANDLTERVQHQQELQLSEQRFSELTEIASDWTWETDSDHRFTTVSERFYELTGAPDTGLIGRRIIEVSDVREAPVEIRNLMSQLHDQEGFSGLVIPLRLGGDIGRCWVRISGRPRVTEDGRFLGFHGTAADVTREHDAIHRADSASRALTDAIESVSEGLALFDSNRRFVMCNRRMANDFAPAAHMLRPSIQLESMFQELLRTGLLRLPGMSAKAAAATVSAELDSGLMRRSFKTSDHRWVSLFLNRSADDGIVMVYSDITAHKKHEAELGAKIDELESAKIELVQQKDELSELAANLSVARNAAEAASRAKSEFLAAMSHELRTPLNAVIGFSEVMAGEGLGSLGNDKYREYSNDILSSGRHLLTLINNILDLSKAESGNLELQLQAVSLRSIIEASVRMTCPRDRDTGIIVDIASEAEEIVADGQKVKQILINLISNAIKFTPEGGRISITATRHEDCTEIRVEDSGIGMRREDIPHAMTAFKQIDSSLGRKFEGTGLGLPLAVRFAELHGGKLKLNSEPGVGTVVIISLPDRSPRAAVA